MRPLRHTSATILLAVLSHSSPVRPNPTLPNCDAALVPSESRPQAIASYRMTAVLDPELHQVKCAETIRWQNPSTVSVKELYLHAYLNAFTNTRTRFLRTGAATRRSRTQPTAPGSLTISQIIAREFGDIDLRPSLATHSPDDPDDATDLLLPLPQSIEPGATLTLDLEFVANLPELVERAGFSRSFHAVAQWFPKIARLEPDGIWRHFSYEPLAEFSSDFGDYDVTLDVPADFKIAAPGLVHTEPAPHHRRRERYCVTEVHDFAWFAWDQFVEVKTSAGPIEIRHYASSEQSANARVTLDAVRWGLDYFGTHLDPYPYASLTVVHPPAHAMAAGGMEYPRLITTGGPWFLAHTGLKAVEAVALHELAHQWFYGIVASDEYRAPVLDEGLASWAEDSALKARFGAGSFFASSGGNVSSAPLRRALSRRYARTGSLARAASEFGDFAAIAGNVYARFPTLLETLERVYGQDLVSAAVSAYALEFRFRHPAPEDLVSCLRRHLPKRAIDALATSLFSDGWVDFGVRSVASAWQPWIQNYSNRILVERRGSLDFPVDLEVEFANGQVARKHLDSVDPTTSIDWPYSSPISAVTIDPDQAITIDDNRDNQTLRLGPKKQPLRLAIALHILASAIWSLLWP